MTRQLPNGLDQCDAALHRGAQWDGGLLRIKRSSNDSFNVFAHSPAERNPFTSSIVMHVIRILAVCTLALAGCTPPTLPCARLGGAPMLEYQLFFGHRCG